MARWWSEARSCIGAGFVWSGPGARHRYPATPNATGNADSYAGSGNSGNSGNRNGDSSEEVSAFLANPPDWYTRQAGECRRKGAPERLLKPLASAVAYEVFGNTNRWSEVLPSVEAALMREKR